MDFIPLVKKYNKIHLNKKITVVDNSKKSLSYGSLGLLSTSFGYITNKQLKSIYFFIKKNIPKNEQFWINVYPNTSITKKSIGSRMGKGKGSITLWVYPIKTNIVFLEFSKNNSNSRKVAYLIKHKLNIKYKIICS